jgi:hypothetical protein
LAEGEDSEFFFFAGGIENITGVNIFFNDLWLFEFEKEGSDFEGEWTKLYPDGPIPSTRAFPGMDVVTKSNGNRVICVFGGGRFDNVGKTARKIFFSFSLVNQTPPQETLKL